MLESLWSLLCAIRSPWRTFRTWQAGKIVYRWNANRNVSIAHEDWFEKVGIHYAGEGEIRDVIGIALRKSTNTALRLIKAAQARGIAFPRYQLDAWFKKSQIDNGTHMQSRLNLAYRLYGPLIPLDVFAECIVNAVELQLLQTKDYTTVGLAKDEPTFATIWREQTSESQLHIAECAAKKGFFLLLKEMYARIGDFNKKMPQQIALECLKAKWPQGDVVDLADGELLKVLAELVNLSDTHKTYGRQLSEAILAVDPRKFTSDMKEALGILALPLLLKGAVDFPEPVERFDKNAPESSEAGSRPTQLL